jgi:hypothetical protein
MAPWLGGSRSLWSIVDIFFISKYSHFLGKDFSFSYHVMNENSYPFRTHIALSM